MGISALIYGQTGESDLCYRRKAGSTCDVSRHPLLLLFTVIGLGYLIGNINIFGFKLGVAAVKGMMSGIQTQPACLAYANPQTDRELPNVWYATVYPASMVAKIILAQVIVSILIML